MDVSGGVHFIKLSFLISRVQGQIIHVKNRIFHENQPNLAGEIIKTSADVPSIFPDPWQNNVTSHHCHNRQPTTYGEVKTRRSSTLFIRSKVSQKKNNGPKSVHQAAQPPKSRAPSRERFIPWFVTSYNDVRIQPRTHELLIP